MNSKDESRRKLRGAGISTVAFLIICTGTAFIFLNMNLIGQALIYPGVILFFIGMCMHFRVMINDYLKKHKE